MKKAIITVIRDTYTSNSTQGKLYINEQYVCETLEDVCRDFNLDGDLNDPGEKKVYGFTAIPAGVYKLKIYQSPKFKRKLFWLQNVPGFEYVLIHNGNFIKDTLGCILVGSKRGTDVLVDSRKALDKLTEFTFGKFDEYELHLIDKK